MTRIIAIAAALLIAAPASAIEYSKVSPQDPVGFVSPEAQEAFVAAAGVSDVVADYAFYQERCDASPNLRDCLLQAYAAEILRRRDVCQKTGTPEGVEVMGWHACEERSYPMPNLKDFAWSGE